MRSFKKGKCCSNQTVTSVSGSSCRLNTTTSAAQRLLISTDEMKVLLVVSVMFALLHLGQHEPCNSPLDNNAYNKFVKKHIVHTAFDRTSTTKWQKYIDKKKLCDIKRSKQTFFEKKDQETVNAICINGGTQVQASYQPEDPNLKNLCISNTEMNMTLLKINNNCKVTSATQECKKVIVGCNKFDKGCLPAHFEKNKGQKSNGKKCSGGRVSGLV
uniref:uncharacterized protein LOC120822350 n=1 Tax=Gasterosteus aculeatus aculeatus TaxID=481459 RepID=UPI001A982FA9|nr:uncharacterized protein LOC120822350 [Gasterosteus aculeatus aculeatus]